MTTPTPDDLRMSADDADVRGTEVVMSSAYVRAAADAWDRQVAELVAANNKVVELSKRLEAAEKAAHSVLAMPEEAPSKPAWLHVRRLLAGTLYPAALAGEKP
jgi:hypothetical protein